MIESVVNVSEGRDRARIARIAGHAGSRLLDVHSDPDHHRSVLTIAGTDPAEVEEATRSVVAAAVTEIDLRTHEGAHPRFGAADVVPFAPLPFGTESLEEALDARRRTARWIGTHLGVPCFLYGPERSLPDLRREAFSRLRPDTGPDRPHPSAGATAVGARPVLVAYNLWLDEDATLGDARALAAAVRTPVLRTLGLAVGSRVQVSCNLVAPATTGPDGAYRAIEGAARSRHRSIEHAELVGLIPESVLRAIPHRRWALLGLGASATVESRLAARR